MNALLDLAMHRIAKTVEAQADRYPRSSWVESVDLSSILGDGWTGIASFNPSPFGTGAGKAYCTITDECGRQRWDGTYIVERDLPFVV